MINMQELIEAAAKVEEKHGAVVFDIDLEDSTIRPQKLLEELVAASKGELETEKGSKGGSTS